MARTRLAILITLLAAGTAPARIITVDDDAPADFNNIQTAINAANNGDIIEIQPGTYTGNGNRDIDFLGKPITVRSTNPEDRSIVAATIIDCNGSEAEPHRAFSFHNGEGAYSVLEGITVTNGYMVSGGGILVDQSSPTIISCVIKNNTAGPYGNGGGIFCYQSDAVIRDCTVVNNTAHAWMGHVVVDGHGGGIFADQSSPTISKCTVSQNTGDGAIFLYNSDTVMNNCVVKGNYHIGIYNRDGNVEIADCTITDHTPGTGIASTGGILTVRRSTVKLNIGGISCSGEMLLTDSEIYHNGPEHLGGGIYFSGDNGVIDNCIIRDNPRKRSGWSGRGGIDARWAGTGGDPNLIIRNTVLTRNTAQLGGAVRGSAKLTNCIISHNYALMGGAIYGTCVIENCQITQNSAAQEGGAICRISGRAFTISNSLIADNRSEWYGGAIYCSGQVRISNCTIANNSAGRGGGWIYGADFSPYFVISNSILWSHGEIEGDEIYATDPYSEPLSFRIEYSDVWSGVLKEYTDWRGRIEWGEGNIEADPCFALDTAYHLLPDSACIDAAAYLGDGPGEIDLDGNPRIIDGDRNGSVLPDMGAYEYNPGGPSIAVSDSNFAFSYARGSSKPALQTLLIRNCGGEALNWEILHDCNWLDVHPATGISTDDIDQVVLGVEPNSMPIGSSSCTLQVRDVDGVNSPVTIEVKLNVSGSIIRVPLDQPTIQDGIDWVVEGGTVMVADGLYSGLGNHDIRFAGKAITVRSENGPTNCTIKCNPVDHGYHRAFIFYSGEGSDSVLSGFTIVNGRDDTGGAILCDHSSPTLRDCIFIGNLATRSYGRYGGGGAITVREGGPTITNCTFSDNASSSGGGFNCWRCNAKLTKCLFSGNEASEFGGAIVNYQGDLTVANCTIVGNSASLGGGVAQLDANSTITNTIFWENRATEIYTEDHGTLTLIYGNVQGSWSGIGNIAEDPCFVHPGSWNANSTPTEANDDFWVDGDYHLKSQAGRWDANEGRWVIDDLTSPCIDAGDPMNPIGPEPFPNGGIINMGAYGGAAEASKSYFGNPACETILAGDINGDCEINFEDFRLMAMHWCEDNNP